MAWKYVMVKVTLREGMNKAMGSEVMFPVIFPDSLQHHSMDAAVRAVLMSYGMDECELRSAGTIETVTVTGLGGGSTTLDVKAHEDDETTIGLFRQLHGVPL